MQRTLVPRLVSRKTFAQAPVQFRVACFPQFIAGAHSAKINIAMTELQSALLASGADTVDAPALLSLVRMASIEYYAVASFQRTLQLEENPLPLLTAHFPPHKNQTSS